MNTQDAHERWLERVVGEISVIMKNTGITQLIICRDPDGTYSYEIDPETPDGLVTSPSGESAGHFLTRDKVMEALDALTDPSTGGPRITVRRYNKVLTDLGFELDEDPTNEKEENTPPPVFNQPPMQPKTVRQAISPANLKAIRNVPLQAGDWAVECTNPGIFLKVHPMEYGHLANDPAFSFFRPIPTEEQQP